MGFGGDSIGGGDNKLMLADYYIMTIGGDGGNFLDVELTSPDPELYPVPECLQAVSSLPVALKDHAGALDYSSEFCMISHIVIIVLLQLLI